MYFPTLLYKLTKPAQNGFKNNIFLFTNSLIVYKLTPIISNVFQLPFLIHTLHVLRL